MKPFRLFLILAVLLAAVLIYLPSFSKYLKLRHKERDLGREIARLQDQIVEIQKEEHLLKTDLTKLEAVVREELGLVKPGEVVYRVVEEEVPEKEPAQAKTNSH